MLLSGFKGGGEGHPPIPLRFFGRMCSLRLQKDVNQLTTAAKPLWFLILYVMIVINILYRKWLPDPHSLHNDELIHLK